MNNLLLFFALPIAVIIISIALQKILKSPLLVAGIIFSVFLVTTIAIGDLIYLIATIVYTILAFIVAIIVQYIFMNFESNNESDESNCCTRNMTDNFINTTEVTEKFNSTNNMMSIIPKYKNYRFNKR